MSAREEWLERLLVGDLDPDSKEARRFFDEHEGAREELEAMRGMEVAIRSVGRERREVVDAATRVPEPMGLEAESFVSERLAESAPIPGPDPLGALRWIVPLAAAAALVLFLWGPFGGAGTADTAPERGPIMGGELVLLPPLPEAGRVDELRWEYELERGQAFQVFVYDPDDPFEPIASSPVQKQTHWSPDPEQTESWPDRFTWEVQVVRDRRVETSVSQQVLRSP